MAQVTGRTFVKINGAQLRSMEGATMYLGGIVREPVVGNEVYGDMEKVEAPYIECEIAHTADLRLPALRAFRDGTVTFECDTGTTYVLRQAFSEKVQDLSGGKVKVKFFGITCEEIPA